MGIFKGLFGGTTPAATPAPVRAPAAVTTSAVRAVGPFAQAKNLEVDVFRVNAATVTPAQRTLLQQLMQAGGQNAQIGGDESLRRGLAQRVDTDRLSHEFVRSLTQQFNATRLYPVAAPSMTDTQKMGLQGNPREPVMRLNQDRTGTMFWTDRANPNDPAGHVEIGVLNANLRQGVCEAFDLGDITFGTGAFALVMIRLKCCPGAQDRLVIRGRNDADGFSSVLRLTRGVNLPQSAMLGPYGWFNVAKAAAAPSVTAQRLAAFTAR